MNKVLLNSKTFILTKNKFLVPNEMTIGNFVLYVRKYMNIGYDVPIIIYHESGIFNTCLTMIEVKNIYDKDNEIITLHIEKDIDFLLQCKWFLFNILNTIGGLMKDFY